MPTPDSAARCAPQVPAPPARCNARTAAAQPRPGWQQLAREIRELESGGRTAEVDGRSISAGCAGLDACLPAGGYLPGSVVEYLRATPACGASYLAFAAAASALRSSGGFLVIVDMAQTIYPPALLCHGIDLTQVIFVRPESQSEALWAVDQALRTRAVAAVVAEFEVIDDRSARRLQLAAERGHGLGVLLRSLAARRSPSWAEVQWIVKGTIPPSVSSVLERGSWSRGGTVNSARQLDVKLARVRGGPAGAILRVEIDAMSGAVEARKLNGGERNRYESSNSPNHSQPRAVRMASQLANPTRPSQRAKTG